MWLPCAVHTSHTHPVSAHFTYPVQCTLHIHCAVHTSHTLCTAHFTHPQHCCLQSVSEERRCVCGCVCVSVNLLLGQPVRKINQFRQSIILMTWSANLVFYYDKQSAHCLTKTQQSANLVAAAPFSCFPLTMSLLIPTQYRHNDTLYWFLRSAAAYTKRDSYGLRIPYEHEAFTALTA